MDLTARAGLALVSETLLALGLDEVVGTRLPLRERHRGYSEFDKLHAVVLIRSVSLRLIVERYRSSSAARYR
jgi:hypothetical protein